MIILRKLFILIIVIYLENGLGWFIFCQDEYSFITIFYGKNILVIWASVFLRCFY